MDPTIALALGGIAGSALKAFVSNDQGTFSKKSLADVLIGGAVGLLYPLYPIISLPPGASLAQQATLIAVIAYFTGDLALNVLQKVSAGVASFKNGTGSGK